MKRTLISWQKNDFPAALFPYFQGKTVYDSSCSREARVYLLQGEKDCFLKVAPRGSLKREAEMTCYFASKGLAAPVLEYFSEDSDYLLVSRVPGEDCVDPLYLSEPNRLCDTLGVLLRELHETDFAGCPVSDRNADYMNSVREGYRIGRFDPSYFLPEVSFSCAEEAYRFVERNGFLLERNSLIHGDYCLPNVILQNFAFRGFVDLGAAGVGDRHIDLFWGAWTLQYNLHTDAWRDRFFSAYGKEAVSEEKLCFVSVAEAFG